MCYIIDFSFARLTGGARRNSKVIFEARFGQHSETRMAGQGRAVGVTFTQWQDVFTIITPLLMNVIPGKGVNRRRSFLKRLCCPLETDLVTTQTANPYIQIPVPRISLSRQVLHQNIGKHTLLSRGIWI